MTNDEIKAELKTQWKTREKDRQADQIWKDNIEEMLQRITTTVFDGNGEKSMVKALSEIHDRHIKEDERTRIYKGVKKGAMTGIFALGALMYHILNILLQWLGK